MSQLWLFCLVWLIKKLLTMKKIFLALSLLFSLTTFAQREKDTIKRIWVGPNIATFATNSFDGGQPFEYGSNLALMMGIARKKTFHNILYLTRNNTVRVLSGWLTKWGDVYICGAKSLSTKNKYIGLGIEKIYKLHENVKLFPYAEIGLDLNGGQSFTIGVVMPVQMTLWKRK